MSIVPAARDFSSPMTRPMSFGELAAGGGNDFIDERECRGFVELLRQIFLEDFDLCLFLGNEIVAVALLELCDRVASLLDHFLEQARDAVVGRILAGVDLALLDRGHRQAQNAQALFIAGA